MQRASELLTRVERVRQHAIGGGQVSDHYFLAGHDPGNLLCYLTRCAGHVRPPIIGTMTPIKDSERHLCAARDVQLRRAQETGAVRADIRTPDLIVLLKALLRSIQDAPASAVGPALSDRMLAVITDGLRRPR